MQRLANARVSRAGLVLRALNSVGLDVTGRTVLACATVGTVPTALMLLGSATATPAIQEFTANRVITERLLLSYIHF